MVQIFDSIVNLYEKIGTQEKMRLSRCVLATTATKVFVSSLLQFVAVVAVKFTEREDGIVGLSYHGSRIVVSLRRLPRCDSPTRPSLGHYP